MTGSAVVDARHAPQVDDREVDRCARLDERAHDRLDRREDEVALQLVDAHPLAGASSSSRSGSLRRRFELMRAEVVLGAQRRRAPSAARAGSAGRSPRDRSRQTATPRTLLPRASRRGEKTPMPSCPGSTASTPPATPLFAGMPTQYTHSPA